jgi:hypothetical protein
MGVSGQHFAPTALYSLGKNPNTHWIGGWVGLIAGLDTEATRKILFLCRGSNPGRPVCSQKLYWLSYPTYGRGEKRVLVILQENLKERNYLEDWGVDGRMGSEWILVGVVWSGFSWLRIGTGGGLLWTQWWTSELVSYTEQGNNNTRVIYFM